MPPDLELLLTIISSNYPGLKLIFMVTKVFEPLKFDCILFKKLPGRVGQSVGHLARKSWVLGWIPGLATYFRFSFRFFKKGSCQLLAKVCAWSTG